MYNTSNELMSTPTVSYTYDNNGSVLTKSDGTQYTWGYENELTQVVLPGTGGTVNFKYDPFGRRIQKSFTQSGTTTTTDYLYDGANRIEDMDTNGNLLARYVQGRGIDKPLEQIASGTTSYYQQDGIGSVTSLSSTSGTIGTNTYTYDSYGNTATSATVVNPFRYTGREFDQETGIYFYRARYYDQTVGRFLSEDSVKGISDGVNFYAYVHNIPVSLIDPSGLTSECPCAATRHFRLVPYSDCSHRGYREIYYELTGPGSSSWWVTEHQRPPSWAGNGTGQSTGQAAGNFDDTIWGLDVGGSQQTFTISPDDPRKVPNTPSCPVGVQLPSGPNGSPQDYRRLGLHHQGATGYMFINGNSTGWVPCDPSFDER